MNIKVVTLFSGYDSQCMALDRLYSNFDDFNYELIAWSEIDKYAIQAHNAIYPQWKDRNLGDVCKIDWAHVSDFDLLTYSSPCTDFSVAGLQKGGEKGSGTRSSLLWECERAIKEKKPKYLLMENVSALVSSKFITLFNRWQSTLEVYGYTNYAKVLNAKNYGVPQNRERIFMISVRIDVKDRFYFPQPFKSNIRLKDILEDKVDEKYYLPENIQKRFINSDSLGIVHVVGNVKDESSTSFGSRTKVYGIDGYSACLCSTDYKGPKLVLIPKVMKVCNLNPSGNGMNGNVFSSDGISPTLTTNKGEGIKILSNFTIRKLTPKEYFRLMDVSEDNIDILMNSGISNSRLYILAGNSIVVNCLYHIFRKLFINTENESTQTELF